MHELAATVEEIPLLSGRMTKGVVRVGDTVRRPTKESSPFVARLLAHLEASGCTWAPRYLGEDEAGRDILSYIPGATPEKWGYFSDLQLCRAACIIRELHERQLRNVRFWSERLADPSSTPTSPMKMLEVIEWSRREAQYTEAHRADFSSALL